MAGQNGHSASLSMAGQNGHSASLSMDGQSGQTPQVLPVPKTQTGTANLANLLPTGTVLAFEALIPSFSKDGACHTSNKYLTATLIAFCTFACLFSSFTDSFTYHGKLYYGIATLKGLYIFNDDEEAKKNLDLSNYKVTSRDFVHAFLSAFVFLVFAASNFDVQNCFFPMPGDNQKELLTNMPLGAGFVASFLFSIFPTRRRGIGYADKQAPNIHS